MGKTANFCIGWDVGGWNCDKNPRSRDAIVILDREMQIAGIPWRGNLRALINESRTAGELIAGLFALCKVERPRVGCRAVMAIDTPLAFSQAFVDLIASGKPAALLIEASQENPYLYRRTEQLLFAQGLRPLSAVKDLIGSQATKGMHVLAKFAPHTVETGVWTDGRSLAAFEAYPSACKSSQTIAALRADYPALDHQDKEDALVCALIAALFAKRRDALWGPPEVAPSSEGWIWVPQDVVIRNDAP